MVCTNLIFCTCKEWQDFMNTELIIRLGQPVVRQDKYSMTLPIEQRCLLVTEAQPKVKGFAKSSNNRLYLPLGIEQVAMFLNKKGFITECTWLKNKVKIVVISGDKTYKEVGDTWYDASGLMFLTLRKDGLIS